MHHVRQHSSVHLFVFRPIGAVHVRDVEIVALVAPAFVEDLLELFFRIEIHAEVRVEPASPRLWRYSICIDDKERGSRWPATKGRRAAGAATTAGRAVDELAAIRAHFISGNAGNERRRASIAQPITDQLASDTTTKASASRLSARCFQVVNDSVDAGMQL